MLKNTPNLWDECWNTEVSEEEDSYNLIKEANSIRFQRIEKLIINKFKAIDGLKVIEIGAGAGTYSALLAKKGAIVTILDYSEKALLRSKCFFERNNINAEFINSNALEMPPELFEQYDVAMSFGLTEHFLGDERFLINKNHFNLIKKGGVALISVPNRFNFPYRIYKFVAEIFGFWRVGEEYPYSRNELAGICKKCGIKNYLFIGDSAYNSLDYISPIRIIKKLKIKKNGVKPKYDCLNIKPEKGSRIDEYFGYALVLCAFKS